MAEFTLQNAECRLTSVLLGMSSGKCVRKFQVVLMSSFELVKGQNKMRLNHIQPGSWGHGVRMLTLSSHKIVNMKGNTTKACGLS